jgi:BirA family biotin operon repressor/biotin-[acetyl-CoA-carboxylase] ligase
MLSAVGNSVKMSLMTCGNGDDGGEGRPRGQHATTVDRLGAAVFPRFRLHRVTRTSSTQDVVRAAARAGADEGFCCVADEQTAGRGREGRTWSAPPRSALLMSLLVRRRAAVSAGIPFAAGLAVLEALRRTCGVAASLKWPNDVMADGGKLAGILAEGSGGDATILGIGVNLTVPSFPPGVEGVSLHRLSPAPPGWAELLVPLLEGLGNRLTVLERAGVAGLREEWMAHALGIGEPVEAISGGRHITGIAAGIDGDGALLLDTANGPDRVLAGDVRLLHAR